MQLSLTCTDGIDTTECVPACSPELHGDLLLANIDGEDSKYSCELHHSRYSWMGAASDGGYALHKLIFHARADCFVYINT